MSVPGFVVAQLFGAVSAILVVRVLYPDVTPEEAAGVVLPHQSRPPGARSSVEQPLSR